MKTVILRITDLIARHATLVLLAAYSIAAPGNAVFAQVAPPLGTVQNFAVLGASTVTNTGPTIISGDLGVYPGTAITGFPPGIQIAGMTHAADAVALQAQNHNTAAYNYLAGEACSPSNTFAVPTDIGGLTLVAGVYCFASSAQLTGTLTLDAQGDPGAVWVFQVASTLITASSSNVLLVNGAQLCNVFWQVGSSATIGTNSAFVGSIFALTSVTLTTNATLAGRALAQTGAVTMDSNTISISACSVLPVNIPPTLGKAFAPATINPGGVSTLTITLSNANSTIANLIAPLTDQFPTDVVVVGNAGTTCTGGTLTAGAGSSTVTLTGAAIPIQGLCTVTVDVTAALGGNYTNSLAVGALSTTNGYNTVPAVATLTVPPPPNAPTLGKAFGPATINSGGFSTLTLTLNNTNATAAALTAPLTDTLPNGTVISGSASNTCGGVATVGVSSVTLTGGSIPANGSCTITVGVTAVAGDNYINSVAAGALETSNGNNAAPAIATLTVIPPVNVAPLLGKAFSPATIMMGGVSTLTITLSNASGTIASLTAPLTDTLPAGMLISGSASNTCGGTATVGASSVTLTGGAIQANGTCTVTVSVTAPGGGNYINSLAAGALETSNGSNAIPAIATLNVSVPSPVTVGKAFSPATIISGGVSTLTITLSNTNNTAAALSAPLTDPFPSGMLASGSASNTCGGTATVGASSVTLTGGSIPAAGSCTVTMNVTTAGGAHYINSIPAGALQTNLGNNAGAAIATLTVIPSVVGLSKAFSPTSIFTGGASALVITLTNPNATDAAITAPLIDALPGGLEVSGRASTTCGGTVVAIQGSSTVTLTGGAIPAMGSCNVTVNVTANDIGICINTIPIGALETSNGSNSTPAVATLTATSLPTNIAPKLHKSFTPATVASGSVSTLTITLKNANSTAAKLTAPLTDSLPSGMLVSGVATSTCGGTVTASASSVTLTGGAIPANGSCVVTVHVIAPPGSYLNSLPAGALQTGKGNNAAPATATLTVTSNSPPKVTKSFSPATFILGKNSNSTLTITLHNSDSTVATLTAPLIDTFPSGMLVAGPASTTCGGTVTETTSSVTLTGGSIPANGSCTVTVKVSVNHAGTFINTLGSGALQTNQGSNTGSASGTLTVTSNGPPTLAKSFYPDTITSGGTSTLTITLHNPNAVAATLTAPLTDFFPSGMTVSGSASTTCGGTATVGESGVTLTGGSIPANGSCTVTVHVTVNAPGNFINTLTIGALETSNGSNTAAARATLIEIATTPPILLKSFSPATVIAGALSTLTITLRNLSSTAATLTAPLTDSLPTGMIISGSASNTCGGTATVDVSSVTLTGGSIPANSSCSLTVKVTANCGCTGGLINILPVGSLATTNGASMYAAMATLNIK
jgi:uncharacterized repeat protein (TIGR01451 family)